MISGPFDDTTVLLREIADHGLVWNMGSRSPTIASEGGTRDVLPERVAKLMQEEILTVGLCDPLTTKPYLDYVLTRKGANMVLASFKGLGVRLYEPGALDENSFTQPDNEP